MLPLKDDYNFMIEILTANFSSQVSDQQAVDTVKWFLALETIGTSRSSSGKHSDYLEES